MVNNQSKKKKSKTHPRFSQRTKEVVCHLREATYHLLRRRAKSSFRNKRLMIYYIHPLRSSQRLISVIHFGIIQI